MHEGLEFVLRGHNPSHKLFEIHNRASYRDEAQQIMICMHILQTRISSSRFRAPRLTQTQSQTHILTQAQTQTQFLTQTQTQTQN
jgi:hypothetical protein